MVEIHEELEKALESDDPGPMETIIKQANPDDFETLQELVQDEETSETYRRRSISALGKWPDRDDEATEAIQAVLPRLTELERITAISALGRIGTPEARDTIVEFRNDDAPDVRRQVVTALARIEDETAGDVIREMADSDEEDYVRELAQEKVQQME